MITTDEFNRVQEILGRNDRKRPKTHNFTYTGIIKWGECGCNITAEEKIKHIKRTGEMKNYIYYHCTRKRTDYKCTQSKNIRVEKLESQISEVIYEITILPEFQEWALEIIREENACEVTERKQIQKNMYKTLENTQEKLDKLTDLLLSNLIDEVEYKRKKREFQKEMHNLQNQRDCVEDRAEEWQELTEKTFNFVAHAKYHFENGDIQIKREILLQE